MQLAPALTVWSAAHVVMLGAVASTTVRVAVQLAVLPAASATVMVTVLAPRLAVEPAVGDCVTTKLVLQLSAATTPVVKSGTSAVQLASAFTDWSAAQVVMLGAVASTTVTVAVQVVVLPAASATVMVTTVAPRLAVLPAAGDCVVVSVELQLSTATTPAVRSGTRAVQLAPALTVWSAAHVVMLGAVVSTTVTVAVQVVVLPDESVAVSVTTVAPRLAVLPAAGDCVTTTGQASVVVTEPVRSGTRAVQVAPAFRVWSAAQAVMTGAVVSTTVTVAVQVVVLPAASAAVRVTVLAPRTAAEPASGDCVTVTEPLLSLATTWPTRFGMATEQLAPASSVVDDAQVVMFGAVVSTTVKVVTQPPVLPWASSTARLMFVTPIGANVPAGGNCTTCVTAQLSVATMFAAKFGTSAAPRLLAEAVWAGAQVVTDGAVVSTTVKVVVHVVVLPAASATVMVTVFAP